VSEKLVNTSSGKSIENIKSKLAHIIEIDERNHNLVRTSDFPEIYQIFAASSSKLRNELQLELEMAINKGRL
jgi:hypothetical protein